MNVYPFVEAEQAGQRNIAKACALLEVSRAAYYQWSRHTPSARAREDNVLGQRIERIHHDSRGTYGAPRIGAQLRREGACVGTRRVGPPDAPAGPRRPPAPAATRARQPQQRECTTDAPVS